jgi:hypothetical protein
VTANTSTVAGQQNATRHRVVKYQQRVLAIK